jgi:pimeloyl-ACP methyl ester carboxylesterase/acyl carrier protein
LDEPSRRAELLRLIRAEAATVSGLNALESVAPESTFSALGLTSLATMELRGRLARTTGVRLPLSLTLDNPTPSALSAALSALLGQRPAPADPVAAPEAELPADLESFYHRLHASGRSSAALELLAEAAAFRGTFTADRLPAPATGAPLSSGRGPTLVCFPSVVASGAPAEYARLGVELGGAHQLVALSEPGFLDGELLPADLDALLAFQAESVLASTGSEAFVLCGHSSGGWVAHATAKRLEDSGVEVAGVVLIDSFWPDAEFAAARTPGLLGSLSVRQHGLGAAGMTRLSAMGGYLKILADWVPLAPAAPTLHLAAGDTAGFERASWRLPHTALEVPGDHLSVLDRYCTDLAKVISSWLIEIPDDRRTGDMSA